LPLEDIGAGFVVKDSTGQKLAYVYYEGEPGRRSAAKLLMKDEARRRRRRRSCIFGAAARCSAVSN
jgi:hypothetical protein